MPRALIKDWSVRTKLVIANAFVLTIVLIASLVLLGFQEWRHSRAELETSVSTYAKMVADSSSAALVFDDREAAQEILTALAPATELTYAAILRIDGTPFADVAMQGERPQIDARILPHDSTLSYGPDFIEHYEPIFIDSTHHGVVYMRATTRGITGHVQRYVIMVAAVGLTVILLSIPLLLRLQRNVTGPLEYLTSLMRRVSIEKDYSVRAAVPALDEIGSLAEGLNNMLSQIQGQDSALKRELRERENAEKRLNVLAHYDHVTNLPNRNFFNEHLVLVLKRCQELESMFGVIFVDLDNFKLINDTLGHDVGDRLLNQVANRLVGSLREGDIACRLGGDEFAIIVGDIASPADAEVVAEKALRSLAGPFNIGESEIYTTASIGISIAPTDGDDMHELLRNADTAMYFAKDGGKNTYRLYSQEMKGKAHKRLALENSLRRALDRDEFLIHYQPQFDIKTNKVIGAEALLRWKHPDYGMVGPNEFISTAEETGLIVRIGEWLLRQALLDMKSIAEIQRYPLSLSINFSGRQFKEDNIAQRILMILNEASAQPSQLIIEITETTLMDASDKTMAKMDMLRAAGISLSLDDFGTGYSSMSYLKRFPITRLKIDRSFVHDVPHDPDDAAIVEAIIAMGKALRMEVIAEGVETQEQLEFLKQSGCENYQGYLFARPMSKEKFIEFMATGGIWYARALQKSYTED
jgi:diguanylate cyclase (GGDEF)-like protein